MRSNTSAYEEEALRRLMKTIAAAKDVRNSPGLSKRERKELEEAIAGAERAARELVKQRTKGGARIKTMQMLDMAAAFTELGGGCHDRSAWQRSSRLQPPRRCYGCHE